MSDLIPNYILKIKSKLKVKIVRHFKEVIRVRTKIV